MADHSKFATLAMRLIAKHGRSVVIQKMASAPADATKPWEGPAVPTVGQTANAMAVFLPVSSASEFGLATVDDSLLKRTEQLALIQPVQEGLQFFDRILDGSLYQRIIWWEALKPADQTVLYAAGLAQ